MKGSMGLSRGYSQSITQDHSLAPQFWCGGAALVPQRQIFFTSLPGCHLGIAPLAGLGCLPRRFWGGWLGKSGIQSPRVCLCEDYTSTRVKSQPLLMLCKASW